VKLKTTDIHRQTPQIHLALVHSAHMLANTPSLHYVLARSTDGYVKAFIHKEVQLGFDIRVSGVICGDESMDGSGYIGCRPFDVGPGVRFDASFAMDLHIQWAFAGERSATRALEKSRVPSLQNDRLLQPAAI